MRINILNYYIMRIHNFNNNYHFIIQNILYLLLNMIIPILKIYQTYL